MYIVHFKIPAAWRHKIFNSRVDRPLTLYAQPPAS